MLYGWYITTKLVLIYKETTFYAGNMFAIPLLLFSFFIKINVIVSFLCEKQFQQRTQPALLLRSLLILKKKVYFYIE